MALVGLPLLLQGEALTWWRGLQAEVVSWTDALKRIEETFAPRRPDHQIYVEIFSTEQKRDEPTESYVSNKRSLIAELSRAHSEDQ